MNRSAGKKPAGRRRRIDRLGALTDMYGRELRDKVRGELCHLIREKTRSSDYLGTFGDGSV
ncbi:MAG: hypothetical protein ACE5H3_00690, partial [Planctomycetota bacterium]